MTTLAALTESSLDFLLGLELVEHPDEDTLSGTMTAVTATMPVTTPGLWKRGVYGEFSDGEVVIAASDPSGSNVTVRRGQRGTTAASRASGDVVVVNPPYPRFRIQRTISEVVRSDLWPFVWTWHRDSLTFIDGNTHYPLDPNVEEVVLVYQDNIDADGRWMPLDNGWWDTERQLDPAVAANGSFLRLMRVYDLDEPVYYTAKLRPTADAAGLTALDNQIADIIPWGVAAKMLAVRSGQVRVDAARSGRDEEGHYRADYRALMSEFIRLRDQLNRVLQKEVRPDPKYRHPFRRKW